jgi:putative serine protease PepD
VNDTDTTPVEGEAAAGTDEAAAPAIPAPPTVTTTSPEPSDATVTQPMDEVRITRPAERAAATAGSPPRSWWQLLVAGVVGAALALAVMVAMDRAGDEPAANGADTTTAPGGTTAPTVADSGEGDSPSTVVPPGSAVDAVAVGEKVIPSIVTVDVLAGNNVVGSGSGVIVTDDGYIVTNDHVVAVGGNFRVVLSDGRTAYDAELVGTDPLTDLAVLDIDATGLTPIEFGSTTDLTVGEPAVAVGSPLGLQGGPSLTVGVLSAFGRQVQTDASTILYGMLQTDAPITSGSSGGALVDGAGRLIGITTAVGVSQVGVEGIGFATPVEIVERVTDELIADGSVQHALLGITGATTFDDATDGAEVAAGVMVESVNPGSAADDAGLAAGDVITSIDGAAIETMDELIYALRLQRPGDQVTLTVDGNDVQVTLDAR